jgi:hypothetical protein
MNLDEHFLRDTTNVPVHLSESPSPVSQRKKNEDDPFVRNEIERFP